MKLFLKEFLVDVSIFAKVVIYAFAVFAGRTHLIFER
jgi:hypothetical protein